LSVLTADPFSLALNDDVFAAIVSRNAYGDSPTSTEFAGALIYLVPDAPINLLNDALVTSDLSIRFTWDQGTSDGGSPVLDYDVYYDEASGNWVLLETGVTDQSYETSTTLTPNSLYSFNVTARNSVGSSLFSDVVTILAARKPDAPISLVTNAHITTGTQVGLEWSDGAHDGGSPILDWRVSFTE
jgi:hypothetical protein